MKWRRGYSTRPPPTNSFSPSYPGNDERYINNPMDIRYSVFESLIRSISLGKIVLHRKLPKTESLKDCMRRTIPYFKNVIYPESILKGKNVLIATSENAIRGLLMDLCEIPEDRISEVEVSAQSESICRRISYKTEIISFFGCHHILRYRMVSPWSMI